jgi:Outer membrane protein beta-barrel domain
MFRRISIPLGLIAIAGAPAAFAGTDSPWSASFTIGTELIPNGHFQSDHSGTVANLGTIDPKLAGKSGAVTISSPEFNDAFDAGPGATLELGYDLTSQISMFGRLSYTQLEGQTTRIGAVVVSGQPRPSELRAEFDDVNSWTLNFGGRYFLTDSTPWRPYVAGYVGADRAGEARMHLRLDGAPVGAQPERLLPRETRFNAGVEFGLNYDFSERSALRFSIGGDYRAARDETTGAYQQLGVSRVRVSDPHWTVPVELGLTYKF